MNIILSIQILPPILTISFLTIVLVLILLKLFVYSRVCYIEYLAIIVSAGIYFLVKWLFKDAVLVREILLSAFALIIAGYSIYDLYYFVGKINAFNKRVNSLLKNAPFDYYFASNEKDRIFDYSNSFLDITDLEDNELYGTLGLQTLLAKLNIVSINNQPISETLFMRFHLDYENSGKVKSPSHFQITIIEKDQEQEYLGIIEPIFYKDKFVGRCVYLSKSNQQALKKIEEGLLSALETIKNDRSQLYAMMSMVENVVMYYDYNTSTYVVTEQMAKMLNLTQREYSIGEFINMIKSTDLPKYQEISNIISSVEVTRIKYNLYLGDKYYPVYDDLMYLNRDSKLISIIHLADYQQVENITEESSQSFRDYSKEVLEEQPEPKEDFKDKLTETLKLLEKVLGE
jgi:hypothetical protein